MAADRIRFHLDEHVDPDIAAALRRHGVDVTTTLDAGLRQKGDDAQIEFAVRTARSIITDDPDFIEIAKHTDHYGIVMCQRRLRTIGQIIRGLILICEVLTPEEMRGRIEFL